MSGVPQAVAVLSSGPGDEFDFRRLLDAFPAAAHTCDADGRITYFNRLAAQAWGREPKLNDPADRYCGSFRMFTPEEGASVPHDQCWMARCLHENKQYFGEEIGIERPNGQRLVVQAYATPFYDAQGNLAGAVNVIFDITERKRTEQQLRQSEEELADFFDNASVGLHWVGPDGIILRVNRAELDLLGYRSDEYLGHHVREFHADPQVIEDLLQRFQVGEDVADCEARLRCKDGSIRHVVLSSSARRENGQFLHTRCFTRDITEQHQAEEAIRALTARLSSDLAAMTRLQQVSARMVQAGNSSMLLHEILDAALDLTGAYQGNLQIVEGETLKIVAQRGFEAPFLEFFDRVHEGVGACGTAIRSGERVVVEDIKSSPIFVGTRALEVMCAAGVRAVQSTPLVNRSGVVVGMFSTHYRVPHRPSDGELRTLDLLARQAADFLERIQEREWDRDRERTLREQEALLRGQMEAFQAALNGQPLDASLGALVRTASRLVGADPGAAFYMIREDGQALRHLVGMPDSYARAVDGFPVGPTSFCSGLAAHSGRSVITYDVETDPAWEAWRELAREHGFRACWSIPVQIPAGPILGTMATYFAHPRQPNEHEARLMASLTHAAAIILSRHLETLHRVEAERSLRESDRRKDEFIAILSHELRNPLAPMRNALELLRRTERFSPSAEQWLETLGRQMTQMVRLVDDLLDVSRISQRKFELKRQRVELGALLREAHESHRSLAKPGEQEILVDTGNEPIYLSADPVRILQVLGNLLSNACRYSGRGARIRCTACRDGDEAVVSIQDDGIGIPSDRLEDIFELFSQVDRSLQRSAGGLGIGLHLTRQMIQMHGGTIRAYSEGLDKGSEFIVRLPIAGPETAEPLAPAAAGSVPQGNPLSRRILIVDDNTDAAETLAMLLNVSGYETDTAFDGEDAVEKALRDRPDVVLLDLGLPKRNGYDVCRTIRSQFDRPHPIVVALSGYGTEEDRRKSTEAGFDAHLVKPVDFAALRLVLEGLEESRPTRSS